MTHTKRSFIQAIVVRALPPVDKLDSAIQHAERLWEGLTHRGYGAKTADSKPRDRADWYGRLGADQREGFDRFWKAYDHKHGKNEAAMVWGQIAPEPVEIPWIIASARIESQNWRNSPPQGQARIYAQGWLTGYRWRDHPQPGAGDDAHKGPSRSVNRSMIISSINALKQLYAQSQNETIAKQIKELEEKLNG